MTTKTHPGDSNAPWLSVLFPHPPIAVPAIAGDRAEDCHSTIDACRRLAARVVARRPERIFLVSPHTPRPLAAFGLVDGPRLHGDFSRFGAPQIRVELPNDLEALGELMARPGEGVSAPRVERLRSQPLDHGALVPLFFLVEAGWRGKTLVASLPRRPTAATAEQIFGPSRAFARQVAAALRRLGEKSVLVASGDMSHRCLPGAPAGFHPRATEFDRQITDLVAAGDLESIPRLDPELRALAAEDVAETTWIVGAAQNFSAQDAEVLSYEHPFGVGYLVAQLHAGSPGEATNHSTVSTTGE